MKIEVLGTGCPKCKQLEANVKKAVDEAGIKAEIVKVTELEKILGYGVMSLPALVVDGSIKASGRVPEVQEIKKWLK